MSRSWASRAGYLTVAIALLSFGLPSRPVDAAAAAGYPGPTAHYVITVAPWVHRWTLAFDCTGTAFTGTGVTDGVPGSEETVEGTVSGGSLTFYSLYTGTDNPGYWWRATFPVGGGALVDMTTSQGQGFEASAVLVETWPDSRQTPGSRYWVARSWAMTSTTPPAQVRAVRCPLGAAGPSRSSCPSRTMGMPGSASGSGGAAPSPATG
jgi:hypothetical protein